MDIAPKSIINCASGMILCFEQLSDIPFGVSAALSLQLWPELNLVKAGRHCSLVSLVGKISVIYAMPFYVCS